jgi:hypothetical protein
VYVLTVYGVLRASFFLVYGCIYHIYMVVYTIYMAVYTIYMASYTIYIWLYIPYIWLHILYIWLYIPYMAVYTIYGRIYGIYRILCNWCPTFRQHSGLVFKGRMSSEGDQYAVSKRLASITPALAEQRPQLHR